MGSRRGIIVSAGEVSGDHYIADVSRRLRASGFDGEIAGLCGAESSDAGVERLWNADRLHIIGISEALGSIADILALKRDMVREIISRDPAALIVVDSPDFNLRLVSSLRKGGYRGRIFYISPPSVWAWRSYRVNALKSCIDENFPLFKFEHDYLLSRGCSSMWIGHPFVGELDSGSHVDISSEIRGARADGRIVALLPGSRRSEIESLYPVLSDVCRGLRDAGFDPIFSVAPGLPHDTSDALIARITSDGGAWCASPGIRLMAAADAVVGASGTVTAQALLLRRFMVVLYKVSAFSAFIGRLVLRNKFFSVPNLLADEMFYPELMQEDARAETALAEALRYLRAAPDERARVDAKMESLASLMGRPGACDFWAERVLEAVA